MLKPFDGATLDGVECPKPRPNAFGLHMRIVKIVRGLTGDLWRVQVTGGLELTVSLIDCFAPPLYTMSEHDGDVLTINQEGHKCYDSAWSILERCASTLSVFVPVPIVDRGWLKSLNADAQLPGWLFLRDCATLNEYLVAKQLARRTPDKNSPTLSLQAILDREAA